MKDHKYAHFTLLWKFSMLLMGVGESYLSLLVIDPCAFLSRSQPDDLEERSVERGSTKRSSLKGREGHRQSDEYWNRFNGNVGETSDRRDEAHMGFSERTDTILNYSELRGKLPESEAWRERERERERVCVRACVCAFACVRVRTCVRACVCVCVCVLLLLLMLGTCCF